VGAVAALSPGPTKPGLTKLLSVAGMMMPELAGREKNHPDSYRDETGPKIGCPYCQIRMPAWRMDSGYMFKYPTPDPTPDRECGLIKKSGSPCRLCKQPGQPYSMSIEHHPAPYRDESISRDTSEGSHGPDASPISQLPRKAYAANVQGAEPTLWDTEFVQ
jgi:hypothetical protein